MPNGLSLGVMNSTAQRDLSQTPRSGRSTLEEAAGATLNWKSIAPRVPMPHLAMPLRRTFSWMATATWSSARSGLRVARGHLHA